MVLLVASALSKPFSLSNGFPSLPSGQHLLKVEQQAGGPLPNLPLPTDLKPDEIMTLQVIAMTEIFEVAFFSTLLDHVRKDKSGYQNFGSAGQSRSRIVRMLKQIVAQEQLHAYAANLAIAASGGKTIGACEYKYTPKSYVEAIDVADVFTTLVLGVLPQVQKSFALEGGAGVHLIPILGSILGQEGQQVGAYRLTVDKLPSSSPFLTGASGIFAYNAIRSFIVEGSCPPSSNVSAISLPTMESLSIDTSSPIQPEDQILTFITPYTGNASHVVYLSGQNAPVIRPIFDVKAGSAVRATSFRAEFPFATASFSKGLTVASLVTIENFGTGDLAKIFTPDDVASKSVAGPGLIRVQ